MSGVRLAVYSQTPFVRFLREMVNAPEHAPIEEFTEGEDYQASPGGVTRMVGALLHRLVSLRRVRYVRWLSLSTQGPSRVGLTDRIRLTHVRLPNGDLREYAAAKASFWDIMHGGPVTTPVVGRAWSRQLHAGLEHLSKTFGRETRAFHDEEPFDAFYAHDFQLLPLATHLPGGPPRLFRWHIPVPAEPSPAMDYAVGHMNQYDAVIVSTRTYARRLRDAGVRVAVHARDPYVGEPPRRVITQQDLRTLDGKWGLRPDDIVFLLVARLDPIKSQDVAIRALARLRRRHPRAKLVLVGGGGFSGGRRGSLGLPHAASCRDGLQDLARRLGVASRVIFTGTIPDDELEVAYQRCRAVLLPSRVEGFGLAPVEGWLRGRPALVSRGAGVAELVRDGENGYVFEPGDDEALARHMAHLAGNANASFEMGEAGRRTARPCTVSHAAEGVWAILDELLGRRARAEPARRRGDA